jgi:cystathionine beta-lyase
MTAAGATDFDIAMLRARRTNKWHKFPPDVLPAWVADMDFGVASSITAALTRLTQNQEYGYAAREGVLAEAFVRRMERRFGWHTDPADTLAIGDLVQASFSSVMAFSEPGDAVLLQLPSYPPFMRAIEDTGRRLIANPMRDDGTRWVLDLAAYEAAPDPRTRMLIFCHPQNPTGRAYSRGHQLGGDNGIALRDQADTGADLQVFRHCRGGAERDKRIVDLEIRPD